MSTVDAGSVQRRRTCGGYTALEIMMTLVLVASMALVIERTMTTANTTHRYMAASAKALERGDKLMYDVRQKVTASRRLFFDDTIGREYLDAADLTRFPPVGWARLPMVSESTELGPDQAGVPLTGNFLFFVSETDAVSAVSDAAAGQSRSIDTYRFMAIYPHETARVVVVEQNAPKAVDLVQWQSHEYPNYRQIMSISDTTERQTVIADLVSRHGYDLAWDPAEDHDSSFYRMASDGTIAGAPTVGIDIDEDVGGSRGGRLVSANVQLARTDPTSSPRRALVATADPHNWKPHGFEVKVVGASRSRQIWIHLVVEVQAAAGQVAAHAFSLIVSVKDL